jgi:hypothetical protein
MSRPIYENAETLSTEERLIEFVASKMNAKPIKLGRKYKIDYAMSRQGSIAGWIELKKRGFDSDRYDEYMLSLDKYMTACQLSRDTKLPCSLVVEFNDKIVFTELTEIDFRLGMGGRKDRGDPEDYEPCCWIPLSEFRVLGVGEWMKS